MRQKELEQLKLRGLDDQQIQNENSSRLENFGFGALGISPRYHAFCTFLSSIASIPSKLRNFKQLRSESSTHKKVLMSVFNRYDQKDNSLFSKSKTPCAFPSMLM